MDHHASWMITHHQQPSGLPTCPGGWCRSSDKRETPIRTIVLKKLAGGGCAMGLCMGLCKPGHGRPWPAHGPAHGPAHEPALEPAIFLAYLTSSCNFDQNEPPGLPIWPPFGPQLGPTWGVFVDAFGRHSQLPVHCSLTITHCARKAGGDTRSA